MKFRLKIKITGNIISDLSEKLLMKIDLLLKKKKVSLDDISKFNFISSGKCGFTARQTGEITAKVLNFGL
jgi:hypothetical protein